MTILVALALLALGLVVLTAGGEALVRGATAIARVAGLTPAVIGLTIVAMGTSLPELVVSVVSALENQPELALGNVVGSNIFNVTAVLGITALIVPLPVRGVTVRMEWPFLLFASALAAVFLRDARLDRTEAGLFVLALVLFTLYMIRLARREVAGIERAEFEAEVKDRSALPGRRDTALAVVFILAGIALLVVGGRVFVDGAVRLARAAGMTERLIGLTVVAAGTGMPEVATSIVAAWRRQTDVAIANMIGSNIFNVFGILGITALVRPIAATPGVLTGDLWWMMGTALLLYPLLRTGMKISRREGSVLVAVYLAYLAVLLR